LNLDVVHGPDPISRLEPYVRGGRSRKDLLDYDRARFAIRQVYGRAWHSAALQVLAVRGAGRDQAGPLFPR